MYNQRQEITSDFPKVKERGSLACSMRSFPSPDFAITLKPKNQNGSSINLSHISVHTKLSFPKYRYLMRSLGVISDHIEK